MQNQKTRWQKIKKNGCKKQVDEKYNLFANFLNFICSAKFLQRSENKYNLEKKYNSENYHNI